jgi:hypothetical protein
VEAQTAIGCVAAQCLDELQEMLDMVPVRRRLQRMGKKPSASIGSESNPARNVCRPGQECGLEGFLKQDGHVEVLAPQASDQAPAPGDSRVRPGAVVWHESIVERTALECVKNPGLGQKCDLSVRKSFP